MFEINQNRILIIWAKETILFVFFNEYSEEKKKISFDCIIETVTDY